MQSAAEKRSEVEIIDAARPRRRPLPVVAISLGASMLCGGLFLAYAISAWLFPELREAPHALSWVLPGFSFASFGRVLLGFTESFAWGLYTALIIGCVYNFIVTREKRR